MATVRRRPQLSQALNYKYRHDPEFRERVLRENNARYHRNRKEFILNGNAGLEKKTKLIAKILNELSEPAFEWDLPIVNK